MRWRGWAGGRTSLGLAKSPYLSRAMRSAVARSRSAAAHSTSPSVPVSYATARRPSSWLPRRSRWAWFSSSRCASCACIAVPNADCFVRMPGTVVAPSQLSVTHAPPAHGRRPRRPDWLPAVPPKQQVSQRGSASRRGFLAHSAMTRNSLQSSTGSTSTSTTSATMSTKRMDPGGCLMVQGGTPGVYGSHAHSVSPLMSNDGGARHNLRRSNFGHVAG